MTTPAKPAMRPARPEFSSGPCAKRPGWAPENLGTAFLGRSHRSKPGKARLQAAIDRTREVLGVPAGYLIGISAIGIGLLTGGILCLGYGYAGYWSALPQPMRFASVLAGLLLLLFIGIRYLGASWPGFRQRVPFPICSSNNPQL